MSNVIKILYIIDCFENSYAGTEGQLVKLISGLDKNIFEPCVVVLRETSYMSCIDGIPFSSEVLNIKGVSSRESWVIMYQYLKKKKSEGFILAHTFFYDSALICPLLLKMLGYKIIVSRRDMGYWYSTVNLLLLRINARFVDRVIANSKAVKAITIRKEWYLSNAIDVIYNGYQEVDKLDVVTEDDIKVNKIEVNLVIVANLRPIKRIKDAIRAVAIAFNSANLRLYIIGDGDSLEFKQFCTVIGVESVVNFVGPKKNVAGLLGKFDVGILCSESEGFSNAIIEYMQAGLPVVCSNVGGNPEIVEDGINGYLYKKGDIEALAGYIIKLAKNKRLRLELGNSGKDKVRNNYSLSKFIEQHERLYEEMCS